ncbi:unnamed protein product, partial [Phaeothamnion confervicola]
PRSPWQWHAGSVVTYLAFPLLEGVLRRALPDWIDQEGVVQRRFPPDAGIRSYKIGDVCSRVGHLLHLLHFESREL